MGYYFRFYGRYPNHWKGLPEFSIQFSRPPTDPEKAALASEAVWILGATVVAVDRMS